MGNCVSNKSAPDSKSHSKYFQQLQAEHLKLMYEDLSSRSLTPGIIRQQFDIFFHLNGLWSASMYKKFDKNKKGFVPYDQFAHNLLYMTKGDFDQKSQVLFDLYNDGQHSGVTYGMLTKMFYSYPKEQINRMIVEQNFLKTIDSYQLACFFDDQNKIKDIVTFEALQIIDQKLESQGLLPPAEALKKMQEDWTQRVKRPSEKSLQSDKPFEKYDGYLKSTPLQVKYNFQPYTQKKVRKNSYDEDKRLNTKNFQLTSNITFLVKKYVKFLFKSFNLDIHTGKLNIEQFRTLLRNHEKIFDVYFQGFHTHVWQYNDQGSPLYKSIPVSFESEAFERNKTNRISRYLILIKNTLFVFNSQSQSKPQQIKNMEGLYVKELQSQEEGIAIYHRDGVYPQHQYVFASKQLKVEWLHQLNAFVKGNINDDFEIIETIGAGKFAKVYYGKEKSSNHQVAIKLIQKNKLTNIEKDSIQKECSILQLCHHPFIIKYIKHYETKNHVYIVTQYLKEGDLFQYVKEKVFLEEYESALIFKQILESVHYLSELGLIHRDLKPENIMVQLNQQKNIVKKVKVIDFGFAIFKKQLEIMPEDEKYAGTPGYMAPQILQGSGFDQSSDMFSLGNFTDNEGIILYFMLSGYLPFYSPIYAEIVQQTKLCNITLRNSHWSNVSKPAKQLVEGLLTWKEQRLTVKQVLEHEWLKNIESLKQFNGMNRRNKQN